MNPSVGRVIDAAAAAGIEAAVRDFPEGTRTAEDAARAIGCGVEQIVKTLVFMAGREPVIAMVSGRHRLDPGRLAAALGAEQVERATADQAREATGFAIGGTPPFGHPGKLRMLIDETLLGFDEVWCAAGTPTTVFPVSPHALAEATGAQVADLHERGA